jgi:hypothetical protein
MGGRGMVPVEEAAALCHEGAFPVRETSTLTFRVSHPRNHSQPELFGSVRLRIEFCDRDPRVGLSTDQERH